MAFDGLVIKSLVSELLALLAGGKIEKIYQPSAEELVFNIHAQGKRRRLYISCASSYACLYLAEANFENPPVPSSFCMLLRKHLSGGRIVDIRQKESERVIEIDIVTLSELGMKLNKRLIVEIMGKHSNIILCDCTTGKILDSIKRVSIDVNRIRQLLPGKLYEYPPSQGKKDFMDIVEEDCLAIVTTGRSNLSKAFLNAVMGISPGIAENLAISCDNLDDCQAAKASFAVICDMRCRIQARSYTPLIYINETNAPVDFHLFPLSAFDGHYQTRSFSSANEMTEFYFVNKAGAGSAKQKSTDLEKTVRAHLQKLYLKKQRLCEDILNAENSDDLRLFGELITANLHNIRTGAKEAIVINYYDGSEVTIPLDIRFSPAKNAQLYFKKYGKAHTAVKEKQVWLEETKQDIQYLESVLGFVENAATTEEIEDIRTELIDGGYLRKRRNNAAVKKSKPAPFTYQTASGLRILAGRNNNENDHLTFKLAGSRDIWFHTKDIPGSHVILFTKGLDLADIAPADILAAASIAAWHSKGRNSENVPVDYVQVKHVKKPSGAKPGMVIFTNNKTVWVNPAQL